MRALKIRAVIIEDKAGGYFIHGVEKSSAAEMFKAMMPLWNFNPATEAVHFVELEIAVPELETEVKNDNTDHS